jgi:hypothetical protein
LGLSRHTRDIRALGHHRASAPRNGREWPRVRLGLGGIETSCQARDADPNLSVDQITMATHVPKKIVEALLDRAK